ncbi:MAG: response regulator [Deltaproteobacteria bacterium]|nr:response regulator [Deltaproteobacteria bacterium]
MTGKQKLVVVVVEDETIIARDIQSKLKRLGYDAPVIASTGEEAIQITEELLPDLVLMDIILKGNVDGIEAADEIRNRFDIPVVYLTAYADEKTLERAKVTEPFGYMLKPFEERELHSTIEMALYKHEAEHKYRQGIDRLMQGLENTINALASMVEIRDPYTAGHQFRVAQLAVAIAGELSLSEDEITGIRLASLVHDIGKMNVPTEILNKPGRITSTEFQIIKQHPDTGYNILKGIEFPWPIAEMVHQHHEKLDGSGYPQGLTNGQIQRGSKIISVADVVEAMSSHRPYRPALGIEVALEEIEKNRGETLDVEAVDACLRLFREKGFNFTKTGKDLDS